MTQKRQIYGLIEALPDDSPILRQVEENLRLHLALLEASEDVRLGRTYTAEKFTEMVHDRWPARGGG